MSNNNDLVPLAHLWSKQLRSDKRHIIKSGKGFTKYCYTTQDLAKLYGVSVGHIRRLVSQRKLDPCSLQSIVDYYIMRKGRAVFCEKKWGLMIGREEIEYHALIANESDV